MTDLRVTSVSQTRLGKSGSAKPQALPVGNRKLNLHVFPWCHIAGQEPKSDCVQTVDKYIYRKRAGQSVWQKEKQKLERYVNWFVSTSSTCTDNHQRLWMKQAQICFMKCFPNAHKLLFQWLDVLEQISHFTIGHSSSTKESLSRCSRGLSAAFVGFCLTSHYFPSLHQQRH